MVHAADKQAELHASGRMPRGAMRPGPSSTAITLCYSHMQVHAGGSVRPYCKVEGPCSSAPPHLALEPHDTAAHSRSG